MFRNKDVEVRYYPNNSIKYRIYIDTNNNASSGTIFSNDGISQLNVTDLDSITIHQIRTEDYFNVF